MGAVNCGGIGATGLAAPVESPRPPKLSPVVRVFNGVVVGSVTIASRDLANFPCSHFTIAREYE